MLSHPLAMSDPLTASVIASIAFKAFLEAGAGEAAKALTGAATKAAAEKLNALRKTIWQKLRGNPSAETSIKALAEQRGSEADLQKVESYLQVAMVEDPQFAASVQQLAQEITLLQIDDDSTMTQVNYGGTNYQTKTGPNNTNFFGGEHRHGGA
ncbi:hypothetical protein [Leptolyngbya sp. PCC 6406]|uniref:hypothetical protein n=1 Tax=Leptolyngbya sp. PCC 6406 TaxID=1173264 RepID=UPI0002ABBD5C|nr:hypothetical protein [Leptolyngbya sp. PCC 6406]